MVYTISNFRYNSVATVLKTNFLKHNVKEA